MIECGQWLTHPARYLVKLLEGDKATTTLREIDVKLPASCVCGQRQFRESSIAEKASAPAYCTIDSDDCHHREKPQRLINNGEASLQGYRIVLRPTSSLIMDC